MDLSRKLARVTLPPQAPKPDASEVLRGASTASPVTLAGSSPASPPTASPVTLAGSQAPVVPGTPWGASALELGPVDPSTTVGAPSMAADASTGGDARVAGCLSPEARLARVRQLLAELESRPSAPRSQRVEGAEALVRAREENASAPLPGASTNTTSGRLHVVRTMLEPDHHHGRVRISHALRQRPELVAELARDAGLAGVDFSSALFLDTETTGLSGGTGTIPFLIGMAAFVDETFEVEQLVLLAPGEERPMLERLRARIAQASCLVTFNGKSFDLPLLITRLVLHRVSPPPAVPHLDLLHSARRVYKRRLSEVRLVRLEEQVLGFHRERDVEGHEIPGIYWNFVRTGQGGAMARVLEHNAHDLVALAALLARLGERFGRVHAEDEPEDHLSMAQIALSAEDTDRAAAFARAAADGGGSARTTVEALMLAARLESVGDANTAVTLLERALEVADADSLLASTVHLRLAKILEHALKDPKRALVHAFGSALAEGDAAHRRRVARLEARMARRSAAPRKGG